MEKDSKKQEELLVDAFKIIKDFEALLLNSDNVKSVAYSMDMIADFKKKMKKRKKGKE